MKTLAIISHKGGSGKTSSSVMLAEEFARRGLRVVLVDADRQRSAGLLVGIEQPDGTVQQTANPKLRYFCSSGIPLRELPARASELQGQFDLLVIDTPSLDDPLARAWLQFTQYVLLTLPVEPISIRTLEGADAALEQAARLNQRIQAVGLLPTIFDEHDSTQRQLMSELVARRSGDVLSPAIPLDPGLAHRAEQKAERRSEPAEGTRRAYQATADYLAGAMELSAAGMEKLGVRGAEPGARTPQKSPITRPAPITPKPRQGPVRPQPVQAPLVRPSGFPRTALVAGLAVVALLVVLIGVLLGGKLGVLKAGADPGKPRNTLAAVTGAKVPDPSLRPARRAPAPPRRTSR